MPKLPNYLDEAPTYTWNPKTRLFDVQIMRGGELVMEFTIKRDVYMMIIARMKTALEDSQIPAPDNVLPLKETPKPIPKSD